MVRIGTHEAFAHGAEVVSYFRWRQAPFAQEQMHTGLNRPDGSPDVATDEIRAATKELAATSLNGNQQSGPASVALIFDYEAAWTLAIQPQADNLDYFTLALSFYQSARLLGLTA